MEFGIEMTTKTQPKNATHGTSNITKEKIEVKVGQVWCDLDKRMNGRCVRVISVEDGKASVAATNPTNGWTAERTTKLSIRRMHKSSTGWALVTPREDNGGVE